MSPRVTFRPLPTWPHGATPAASRRSRWTFKASYGDTLGVLEQELIHLHAHNVLIGIGLSERDIRLDGMPRANAPQPLHPGVELSFDSKFGRLTYATDTHEAWQHNLRAIALSLQALRAVDRYGVSKRGEQYAGWALLTAGGPDPERGRQLVERAGSLREAMRRHHPDQGGDQRDIVDVLAYRSTAEATGR